MKVLVFAKQVPDVNSIRFDPATNRIVRENVPLSMNSFDRKAVEEAIRMKEKFGFHTVVASMGPPQAADILNESLRMGADEAYLITDRKFGGSDTLATSRMGIGRMCTGLHTGRKLYCPLFQIVSGLKCCSGPSHSIPGWQGKRFTLNELI